jgi:hypothetical protein
MGRMRFYLGMGGVGHLSTLSTYGWHAFPESMAKEYKRRLNDKKGQKLCVCIFIKSQRMLDMTKSL